MPQKIVINRCFGGFDISNEAEDILRETSDYSEDFYFPNIRRKDPNLIAVVEKLGHRANGPHAELKIVEVPDDVKWTIKEYDGLEHVAETHRTWR